MARTGDDPAINDDDPIGPVDDPETEREEAVNALERDEEVPTDG